MAWMAWMAAACRKSGVKGMRNPIKWPVNGAGNCCVTLPVSPNQYGFLWWKQESCPSSPSSMGNDQQKAGYDV